MLSLKSDCGANQERRIESATQLPPTFPAIKNEDVGVGGSWNSSFVSRIYRSKPDL